MKLLYKTLLIGLLMLQVNLSASAQLYSTANNGGYMRTTGQSAYVGAQQNNTPSYTPYQSTVYEPFSSITPSQRAPISRPSDGAIGDAGATGNQNDVVIPDGFGNLADPGYATSPVGEAWVLAIFAALFAIFTAIKQRKQEI